jgi:cysteinyl-tRNA synthetase
LSEKEILELIDERNKSRAEKNFKRSDEIRKSLSDKGVILEDAKDGTVWRRKA